MTLLCVTNTMSDARPCTSRNQHRVTCDGVEYRYNPDHHRDESTGKPCTGCLPRLAEHGLLCWKCWERVRTAYAEWTPLRAQILRVIGRAVQRDNGGIRTDPGGYIPLPATLLAYDEIESYLRSLGDHTLDVWVSTPDGAADAFRFARAVTAALRTHELVEKPHRINRIRCPQCQQITLIWNPTQQPQDDVTVNCSNPECVGAAMNQDLLESHINQGRATA